MAEAEERPDDKIIEIAKAVGWSETGPLGAEEFLKTMPNRFRDQGKELKEIKSTVRGMAKHYKDVQETSYKRGLAEAETKMREAKETGDIDAYEKARNQRETLKNPEPEIVPEVDDWSKENPWFDKDKAMTTDALDYAEKYRKTHPGADVSEVLEYVGKKIRKDYPDKFEEQEEVKPQSPEGARNGGSRSKDPIEKLKNEMTSEEKNVMAQFVKWGNMTEKEYLESYAQVRGI